jgi:predicted esterase
MAQIFTQAYPPLNEKGFTVFAVRHGSWPRYPLSSIVADMRRSVRFIRQHAKEYGVDPSRIGVFGNSSGGQAMTALRPSQPSSESVVRSQKPPSVHVAMGVSGGPGVPR